MTTISPNRRRTGPSRIRFALYAAAFVLAFIAMALWREPLSALVWRAAEPVLSIRQGIAASGGGALFSGLASNKELARQNEALRAQLASSTIALMDRNLLYADNIQLKERLGRVATSTRSIVAAVILRPPGTPYDTLMLDAGSNDGVAVGDLVAAGGSVYIGKISQVYAGASRATLFSAPGEAHDALVVPAAGASVPVSLSGQGSGSLTGEVPAATQVAPGDAIVLQNLGIEFIATVTAVDSSAQNSFKTIYTQLPVNPLSLRFVEVRPAARY